MIRTSRYRRGVSMLFALMILLAVAIAIAIAAATWISTTYEAYGGGKYEALEVLPPTNITIYVLPATESVSSVQLYLTLENRGNVEAKVYKVEVLSSDGRELIQAVSLEGKQVVTADGTTKPPVVEVGRRETWIIDLDPSRFAKYISAYVQGAVVQAHFMVRIYTESGKLYPGIAKLVVEEI